MSSRTRQSVRVAPLPPATAALPIGQGARSPGTRVHVLGSPQDPSVSGLGGECLGRKRVCRKVPKRSVWALADMVLKSLSLCSPVPSAGTSLPCCVVCHRSPG